MARLRPRLKTLLSSGLVLLLLPALLCIFLLKGCAGDGGSGPGCGSPTHQAGVAFDRFQQALFAGDGTTLRETLTSESRLAVDALLQATLAGKKPLVRQRVEGRGARFSVFVFDPNEDREGRFSVVREDGRYVVDLMETTASHHVQRSVDAGSGHVVPASLSPDQVRQAEALLEKQAR